MNKVVLITGASSGIGKAIGEYLHQQNFTIYGTSRSPEKYKNSIFTLLSLDVNDVDSIQHTVNHIIEKENRIDVLINNAGKGITGPLEETPITEMKKTFDTNFFGVMQVCNAVLPQMRKQNNGLIINVSSIAELYDWKPNNLELKSLMLRQVILLPILQQEDFIHHYLKIRLIKNTTEKS